MKVENFQKVGLVYLKSLDSLLRNKRFNIAKDARVVMQLNVDGFEPFAIIGAKSFIARFKPGYIIFSKFCRLFIERSAQSIGWSANRSKYLPNEFLRAMSKYGYKYTKPSGSLHSSREIVFTERNFLKYSKGRKTRRARKPRKARK